MAAFLPGDDLLPDARLPKHAGAFDLHPEEYEQRVIAFFDSALLGIGGATGD